METEQNNLIDLRKIFTAKVPKLMKHMPDWLFRKIQRLLHEDDINEILTKYADKTASTSSMRLWPTSTSMWC